jgi:hypothetical protein
MWGGANPYKLQMQIAKYGTSTVGMPTIEVLEAKDGMLVIYNGVTRATRIAKLMPGALVRVEITGRYPRACASYPTVGDRLP